jgi:predicted RNase H-like HicB family nuclease
MKCAIWLSIFLLASCWALSAQDLSPIIEQAETLTALLENIEQANNEQRKQLQDLSGLLESSESELTVSKQAITDLKTISEAQGEYVNRLSEESKKQQAIYEAQLSYQKRLQLRSKILTVSLLVALPVTAALGIWAGSRLAR